MKKSHKILPQPEHYMCFIAQDEGGQKFLFNPQLFSLHPLRFVSIPLLCRVKKIIFKSYLTHTYLQSLGIQATLFRFPFMKQFLKSETLSMIFVHFFFVNCKNKKGKLSLK